MDMVHMKKKRDIVRARDTSVPAPSSAIFACKDAVTAGLRVWDQRGGISSHPLSDIVVVSDMAGRKFKIEITQVDGPQ